MKYKLLTIFTILTMSSYAQRNPIETINRIPKICIVKERQKECLLNFISNHVFSYIGDDDKHSVYFLRVKQYITDSIVSLSLERICDRDQLIKKPFIGCVKRDDKFFLIIKSNSAETFIKDFNIEPLNEEIISKANEHLYDTSKSLFGMSSIDELGGVTLWSFDYDYKKRLLKNTEEK